MFLELCSKSFALVPLFKALTRCTNKGCFSKGILPSLGSQFGSAVGTAKQASGVDDPPYEGGLCSFQLKSEIPSSLVICI